MEKVVIELRAAEGGKDAELLVEEMADIYQKAAKFNNFSSIIGHWMPGFTSIVFSGDGVKDFFQQEIGGHRWQRTPPTEAKGRVHTSTVTVAVLSETIKNLPFKLDRREVDRIYTRGSGNGGQNRNKVESVVVLTHKPTGIQVRCEKERDRHKNEKIAWEELERRLLEKRDNNAHEQTNNLRANQIGSGERGDKRRTYRVQDNSVKDDITGKVATIKELYKGRLDLLHN